MCFIDGQLLGDEKELLEWSYHEWDYRDFKPEALYRAIAEDFYVKHLKNSQASGSVFLTRRYRVSGWRGCQMRGQVPRGGRRASPAVAVSWFLPRDGGVGAGGADGEQPPLRTAVPPCLPAARKGQTLAPIAQLVFTATGLDSLTKARC